MVHLQTQTSLPMSEEGAETPPPADREQAQPPSSSDNDEDRQSRPETAEDSSSTVDPDRVICEGCENDGEKYCGKCRQILCTECWAGLPLHRRNDPRHPVIPYEQYKLFKDAIDPSWTEEQWMHHHKQDLFTLWFSVDRQQDGKLGLEEYPRLKQLSVQHRRELSFQAECYAQVASFIGDTRAGKSTLIRSLMQRPWDIESLKSIAASSVMLPIVGRDVSQPTSGDVHLYRAPHVDATQPWMLLLYADSEGFYDGSKPSAAKVAKDSVSAQLARAKADKKPEPADWMEELFSFFKPGPQRLLSSWGNRQNAVKELFPRLLYNFSDVIVYTMPSSSVQKIEAVLVKLVEWAQNSRETAVNRVVLPHLIVVLNRSPATSTDWDAVETTKRILTQHKSAAESNRVLRTYRRLFSQVKGSNIENFSQLLRCCYSSVQFIRVPETANPTLFSHQLQRLDSMIRDAACEAEKTKTKANFLLPTSIHNRMVSMAFDHYKDREDQPFDFLESLFIHSSLSEGLSRGFFELLKAAEKANRMSAADIPLSGLDFCSAITPVICSTVAVDACRSSTKYPGRLQDIYKGSTMDFLHAKPQAGGATKTAVTYQKQVAEAVDSLFDRVCECDFIGPKGQRCVTARLAHDNTYLHQDKAGKVFSYGTFQSEFVDQLMMRWNDEIDESLRMLDELQGTSNAVLKPGRESESEARYMVFWAAHCANLQELYSVIPGLEVRTIEACSWCLRGDISLWPLSCGHRICWQCAQLLGDPVTSVTQGEVVGVRSCDLHRDGQQFKTCEYIAKGKDGGVIRRDPAGEKKRMR